MDVTERVARALAAADGFHPDAVSNDEDEVPAWKLYVKVAVSAIEAMDFEGEENERDYGNKGLPSWAAISRQSSSVADPAQESDRKNCP